MFYFHCIALVFLFIFPVTFFGCDDNVSPVNKGGNVNHKDTSIFFMVLGFLFLIHLIILQGIKNLN